MELNPKLADLHFDNIQLLKLVSTAEILLRHVYNLVTVENRSFIDQWLCFKQEYDQASSHSQCDVNENIPELNMLAPIDEVSENEKASSSSDLTSEESFKSSEMSDSNKSFNGIENDIDSVCSENFDTENSKLAKLDADVVDHMTEFEMLTDAAVTDWFKKFTLNTSEMRDYLNWLQNRDNGNVWNSVHKKNDGRNSDLEHEQNTFNNNEIMEDFYQDPYKPIISNINESNVRNLPDSVNRIRIHRQQIQQLHSLRETLLRLRETINFKFKEEKVMNSVEHDQNIKLDIAFEIIDNAIEMKNSLMLGLDIAKFCYLNDSVDTTIADCLQTLSLPEMRSLFLIYMKNIVEIRISGLENDKKFLKLDNEITNQKFVIWRLYKALEGNKHQITLRKEFEEKLQLISKIKNTTNTQASTTAFQAQKFFSIVEKTGQINSELEATESEGGPSNNMSLVPLIAENIKKHHHCTPHAQTKVTRIKKKLIIESEKK